MQPTPTHWFRNTVLYQIYPRSFFDANGDGIGDLRGITQRLRYLNGDDDSLGMGAIWLSPFYPSPMDDFGYDVMDHCNVDPIFGNLDDFTQLLEEAHKRSIKVFIDFIPNHTSYMHTWFQESKSSLDDPRRDWYVWRDPGPDGGPPNNWLGVFGGSAWEFDEATRQYYLHSFLTQQPDLNWENAGVREAIKQIMRFWLDMGVDGFRVDAVYWISKDTKFRNDPPNKDFEASSADPYYQLSHINSKQGPKLYKYMGEMAKVLHSYADRFMIVEAAPDFSDISKSYLDLYRNVDASVSAPFNFEGIFTPWKAEAFRAFIDRYQEGMHPLYVPVYCLGNHDHDRLLTRIGEGPARVAAMLQLSLPGMPVVYYGDELGMASAEIAPEDVRDRFELQQPGKGLGRDPGRMPMQWNGSEHAGFSKNKPWLPVNADYTRKNADAQQLDPNSMLNLYKGLLRLRKSSETLRHGSYESFDAGSNIYCFERRLPDETLFVVLNFSDDDAVAKNSILSGKVLVSTYLDEEPPVLNNGELKLRPHEGVILRAEHV
ncbi:alpha-amylase family glycosyl hydrolase [soil metagenome]